MLPQLVEICGACHGFSFSGKSKTTEFSGLFLSLYRAVDPKEMGNTSDHEF